MTATFIAIHAANTANTAAAIAAAQAAEARAIACKSFVAAFDSKSADVSAAKQYASCVQTLYPDQSTPIDPTSAKVIAILVIACMVAGVLWLRRSDDLQAGWFASLLLGPLFGLCGGALLAVFVGICFVAVRAIVS